MGVKIMSEIKIETTVRRDYDCENENVSIDGLEKRNIILRKEIKNVETFYHLLECSTNDAVRHAWNSIKDEDEWVEWGWYGPYAQGEITLTGSRTGVTWLEIAEHIAKCENITVESAFMKLRSHARTSNEKSNMWFKQFLAYIAEEKDVDTSGWVHGYKPNTSRLCR